MMQTCTQEAWLLSAKPAERGVCAAETTHGKDGYQEGHNTNLRERIQLEVDLNSEPSFARHVNE